MQQIKYKRGFATIKVGYAKGVIEYRGKTLTKKEITGFGIGTEMGHASRSNIRAISKTNDLKTIGGNLLNQMNTMLVVAYKKPHEEKIRSLLIPVMIQDPACFNFLEQLKKDMKDKYIGVGNYHLLIKELKISQKSIYIFIFIVIILIVGIGIFMSTQGTY